MPSGTSVEFFDQFSWIGVGRSGQLWTVSQPECLGICVSETRGRELAWTADGLQVVSAVQPVFDRSGETNGAVSFVGATEPRTSSALDVLVTVGTTLEIWTGGPVEDMQREVLASDVSFAGVADFNADGHVDALVGSGETLRVAWGTAAGFWSLETLPQTAPGLAGRRLSRAGRGDALVLRDGYVTSLLAFDPCR